MSENPILLFDGVCNLCNSSVQFIIKHDSKSYFKFASLQSEKGQTLLKAHNLNTENFDTLILIENGQVFNRSTAALKIARHLDGFWHYLYFLIAVPTPIRNLFYNFVAKNRYKFFGKKDECMIPTPELKARFLS